MAEVFLKANECRRQRCVAPNSLNIGKNFFYHIAEGFVQTHVHYDTLFYYVRPFSAKNGSLTKKYDCRALESSNSLVSNPS